MSDELKKIILETYLKHTENESTTGLWYHEIAEELGLDKNQVATECAYLEDDGYIEKIEREFFGKKHNIGVRITSKGKEALRTIYNLEWTKQNRKEQKEARDIEERRHQELVNAAKGSSKIIKIGVAAAIVISLLSLFGFEDIWFNPNIEINPFFTDPSDSTTQMYLNIWNHGNSPATNVRVTLNPNADFLKTDLVYSAEDTIFSTHGPRALVAFTPRLSAGDLITIDTIIDIPLDRSHFDIYVTYDQGEKVSYSSELDGKTPFDQIIITLPEEPESVEVSIYDPAKDEFIPVKP